MIVVDTNVIAYLVIDGPMTPRAEALRRLEAPWVSPALWRSEMRNLLLGYLRRKDLTFAEVIAFQTEAERVMAGGDHWVMSESVIRLAESSGCTAYDCEFVALSIELGVPLYTADRQLIRAFPAHARMLPP